MEEEIVSNFAVKRRNIFNFLIGLTTFTVILAGCGSNSNKDQTEEGSDEIIRIGYVNILSNASAVIAENEKLIDKQGLK